MEGGFCVFFECVFLGWVAFTGDSSLEGCVFDAASVYRKSIMRPAFEGSNYYGVGFQAIGVRLLDFKGCPRYGVSLGGPEARNSDGENEHGPAIARIRGEIFDADTAVAMSGELYLENGGTVEKSDAKFREGHETIIELGKDSLGRDAAPVTSEESSSEKKQGRRRWLIVLNAGIILFIIFIF
jgi:hypothetical protein